METIYLCIIIFLFVLAVFDLIVGVSNDAVNFLNSAVGAKAASFKTILFIAGIGIFIGASLSNGMMDIARHGIYQPEHFYFAEIMCILLAVMLTDVVLLDVFNSMGMPTSTTVSLVFELLGGTFALSLIKVHNSDTLGLGDLINTDKALSVIMAIFVSVAIAFFFEVVVLVVFHFLTTLLNQIGDIFGYIAEFTFLDGVQWVEVVVDMFEARFAEAGNTVDQFAGEVVALIVVESFFEHGVVVEAAHGNGSGAFHLLDELLFEFRGTHGTT